MKRSSTLFKTPTSRLTINKATPSIRTVCSNISAVPVVDDMSLSEAGLDRSDISIGNRRFGSCSLTTLNDSFHVCVKSIVSFSIDNVKAEAAIMISLNLTPYCFGVNLARKAIVMSHISIDGKATTLYSALKTHESLAVSVV